MDSKQEADLQRAIELSLSESDKSLIENKKSLSEKDKSSTENDKSLVENNKSSQEQKLKHVHKGREWTTIRNAIITKVCSDCVRDKY